MTVEIHCSWANVRVRIASQKNRLGLAVAQQERGWLKINRIYITHIPGNPKLPKTLKTIVFPSVLVPLVKTPCSKIQTKQLKTINKSPVLLQARNFRSSRGESLGLAMRRSSPAASASSGSPTSGASLPNNWFFLLQNYPQNPQAKGQKIMQKRYNTQAALTSCLHF